MTFFIFCFANFQLNILFHAKNLKQFLLFLKFRRRGSSTITVVILICSGERKKNHFSEVETRFKLDPNIMTQ